MKKNTLSLALLGTLLGLAACETKDITPAPNVVGSGGSITPTNPTTPTATVTVQTGTTGITTNTTWTASNKYLLKGFVYVRSGATLTIEPGTIIFGDKDTKGALIIEPGAKIMAAGTAARPIIFTSNQPKGARNYGDWGGIIITGNAPVNTTTGQQLAEGGVTTIYGGTNATDNSGVFQYVRIEFAGVAFTPNNEVNGLTLGGVGSGTTIDHVQVSYSGDDAFEWFGGTLNAKYLVAHRTFDDDFDTDLGSSGNAGTLRRRLNAQRYRPRHPATPASWWQRSLPEGCLWSGEAAAHLLLGQPAPPTSLTIYSTMPRPQLVQQLDLVPASKGPIELLNAFAPAACGAPTAPGCVPPLLVYADLLAAQKPACEALARELCARYLAELLA